MVKRLRFVARGLFAGVAIVAVVFLVRRTGVESFLAALTAALPWIPSLLLLEGIRIAADLVSLRLLCGAEATKIPLTTWIRLHLVANTALVVLPGGRLISEGMKIARLRHVLGVSRATSVVGMHHVLTLVGVALTSFLAAFVAWYVARSSALAAILAAHAASCVVLAAAIPAALRRASLVLPRFSCGSLGAKITNRAAQVAQFVIVIHAVTGSSALARALLAGGVSLLGGVIGELSIAQLGCTEGAFVASASALSLGVSGAVAITSLMRVVQLFWCLVGSVFAFSDRFGQTPSQGNSHAI